MRPLLFIVAATSLFAGQKLGKPLTLKEPVSISAIQSEPSRYVGQIVQVKGKVSEVCQMMGCWMNLVDGEKSIRIKVNDGDIVFPKESVGKNALAEGKLVKIELTKEQAIAQAKHEAEETGRKFNPHSVKSGVTIFQIQGSGAVLLD